MSVLRHRFVIGRWTKRRGEGSSSRGSRGRVGERGRATDGYDASSFGLEFLCAPPDARPVSLLARHSQNFFGALALGINPQALQFGLGVSDKLSDSGQGALCGHRVNMRSQRSCFQRDFGPPLPASGNGLLLRTDIHRLFDLGYVNLRAVLVSRSEDAENLSPD